MTNPDQTPEAGRHRRLVSQVLIAGLIAVAYSEPVSPVSAAFNEHGVNVQSLAWLFIYVTTVLRFFIGNIVHLENRDLTVPDAVFRWFWDMSFVVAECIVLIFAGAVTTIDASTAAHVSFTDYLIVLYTIDVVWLVSIQILSYVGNSRYPLIFRPMVRKDDMAPFQWAVVNIVLGIAIWALGLLGHPTHVPCWKLYVLLGANAAVFLYDVVQIAYGIRDRES
jgi:hypothetical protein